MKKTEILINDRLWKILIMRGGLLDDFETQRRHRKAIEYEMYSVLKGLDSNSSRWRNATSPIEAMRLLVKEGVPLSFLRDNVGIIARRFSWEKVIWGFMERCIPAEALIDMGINYDDYDLASSVNRVSNRQDKLIKSIDIETKKSKGIDCFSFNGREIKEVNTTNNMGIVWTEVLMYYNYVQKQANIINKAIDKVA